jgi:hypothetical protein
MGGIVDAAKADIGAFGAQFGEFEGVLGKASARNQQRRAERRDPDYP